MAGTSGGGGGASGDAPRRLRIAWLIAGALLFTAVQSVANVESTIEDMAALGRAETRAHVWTWQLSSAAVWFALLPVLWWLVAQIRPPRFSWPVTLLLHAAATIPVSLVHVVAMVAVRKLVYALGGESYDFGNWGVELLYEYRKDVPTYLIGAAYVAFAQWQLGPIPTAPDAPGVLLITDGSVTYRVPMAEIDWAGAAGNYVEIAWGQRILLHRSTLAALEDALGGDFVRIHRGRLVRRATIRQVETDRSGDFTVTLSGGTQLRGSRRYRGLL